MTRSRMRSHPSKGLTGHPHRTLPSVKIVGGSVEGDGRFGNDAAVSYCVALHENPHTPTPPTHPTNTHPTKHSQAGPLAWKL